MSRRQTTLSAAASYIQLGVGMASSLLLVRVATQNMSPQEFGLWSFVFGSVGYFILLDFGVSFSLGRVFSDSISAKNEQALSGLLVLSFLILLVQGVVIFAIGLILRDWVLGWFSVSSGLLDVAGSLWTWCLAVQAAALPLRVFSAVLHSQNRAYVIHVINIGASLLNLLVFWVAIRSGYGVMAYAYAFVVSTIAFNICHLGAVFFGARRIRLVAAPIPWKELPGLLHYAFAIFASSFGSQASGAAQIMILTKFLGLDAAAIYAVTSRVPSLLPGLVLKLLEAFRPRWYSLFCTNRMDTFRSEYVILTRISILGLAAAFVAACFANPAFVVLWTTPRYFGGVALTAAIAAAAAMAGLGLQLNVAFQMHKKMRLYTIVTLCGSIVEILLSIFLVPRFGLMGVPFSTLVAGGGFVFLFNLVTGSRMVSAPVLRAIADDLVWWLPFALIALVLALSFGTPGPTPKIAAIIIWGAGIAVLAAPMAWRGFVLVRNYARSNPQSPIHLPSARPTS